MEVCIERIVTSALRLDELMHLSWIKQNNSAILGKRSVLQFWTFQQQCKRTTRNKISTASVVRADPSGDAFKPKNWLGLQSNVSADKAWTKSPQKRPLSEWVGKIISRIGKEPRLKLRQPRSTQGACKVCIAHDLRRSCGNGCETLEFPPCNLSSHATFIVGKRLVNTIPWDLQKDAGILVSCLRSPQPNSARSEPS